MSSMRILSGGFAALAARISRLALGPWMLACFIGVSVGGCNGCNSSSSSSSNNNSGSSGSSTSCRGTLGGTFALVEGVVGNSVVYTGGYGGGLPSSCTNRVDYLQNTNAFSIRIATKAAPANCQGSGVLLPGLNAHTQPADMMQIFGELNPKLPIAITACATFTDSPPQSIGMALSYTSSP
jgi:hypothetical protein